VINNLSLFSFSFFYLL